MITNKHNSTEVASLGYSDLFAQVLCFLVNKQYDRMGGNTRSSFSRRNIEHFKYLLENELWAEIRLINNLNDSYKLFLSTFIYYLESAFLIITYYKKKAKSHRWITKGIKVSCHRMRFLNNLKRNSSLTSEGLNYINRSHLIYERVISEGKKGERE